MAERMLLEDLQCHLERRHTMRITCCVLMIAFVAVALLGEPALADELAAIELDEVIVATAEVVGIDRVDRTLVLLGPEGEVITVEVGHAARNFDQIRIGDEIEATYYQSVAVSIERAGGKLSESDALVAARAPEGSSPGAVVVETVEVSAEIVAIDRLTRKLTLKLPDGRKVKTRVDEDVKIYNDLRVRDLIHVRYTEAVAVTLN
jgi:hypothetical protein